MNKIHLIEQLLDELTKLDQQILNLQIRQKKPEQKISDLKSK